MYFGCSQACKVVLLTRDMNLVIKAKIHGISGISELPDHPLSCVRLMNSESVSVAAEDVMVQVVLYIIDKVRIGIRPRLAKLTLQIPLH